MHWFQCNNNGFNYLLVQQHLLHWDQFLYLLVAVLLVNDIILYYLCMCIQYNYEHKYVYIAPTFYPTIGPSVKPLFEPTNINTDNPTSIAGRIPELNKLFSR